MSLTTQIKSFDIRTFFLLNFLIPNPVGILAATLREKRITNDQLTFKYLLKLVVQGTGSTHKHEPAAVRVEGNLLQHLHLLLAVLLQLLQVELTVLPKIQQELRCSDVNP